MAWCTGRPYTTDSELNSSKRWLLFAVPSSVKSPAVTVGVEAMTERACC